MLTVKFIEPGVELRHSSPPVELDHNGLLRQGGDVQALVSCATVEVIRKTYVSPCHTHTLHN